MSLHFRIAPARKAICAWAVLRQKAAPECRYCRWSESLCTYIRTRAQLCSVLPAVLLLFVPAIGENGREVMPNTSRTLEPPFTDVPGAVAEIRAGRMVVVVDDEDRENEGDLTLAAEHVTPEAINFMARYGRGLICLTLTEERADYLRLFPMTQQNSSRFGTAFTETIEAREGVTTGISAADRAHTIRTAIDPAPPIRIWPGRGTFSRCVRAGAGCW